MIKRVTTLLFTITLTAPSFLFASDPEAAGLQNPLKAESVAEILDLVLNLVVQIGFPILVLAIIWCGFMFVQAQGKPEALKTARDAFLWTCAGAGVILAAKAISVMIQTTINNLSR